MSEESVFPWESQVYCQEDAVARPIKASAKMIAWGKREEKSSFYIREHRPKEE